MIKIAICDDEIYMIEMLDEKITTFFEHKNMDIDIFHFSSGSVLLQSDEKMDIIFLDIQMDRLNGLETAKELRRRKYKGFLIFVTVFKEYVFDTFEVQAFDYLVKPLQTESFMRTMNRLFSAVRSENAGHLLIQRGDELDIVLFGEILYCEVINRKVYLHLKDARVLNYYEKIENLEKKLDERFFKCHRSYLVNLQYLKSYKKGRAYLTSGEEIPVSRLRSGEFSNSILQYMKKRRYEK